MYRLHYSKIDAKNEDILCFVFKKHKGMLGFIDENLFNEVVYIILRDGLTDCFVSSRTLSIIEFLETKHLWQTVGDYHLFECDSFEEAYKIALSNSEASELCYSK
jgi:hypothetical protein